MSGQNRGSPKVYFSIKRKDENLYIHFNPKTSSYFTGDKLLGSVGFYEDDGNQFIRDRLDNSWILVPIHGEYVPSDRNQEHELFNSTH